MQTFKSAGVSYVVSKQSITAKMVTSYLYEEDVAECEADFLSATQKEDDYDIQQYLVTRENPYANKPYGELFWKLKHNLNILPMALSKPGNDTHSSQRTLYKIPDEDMKVEEGDYVVMALKQKDEPNIEEIFGVQEGIVQDTGA